MISGIINVYKEKGWTSHDVVAKLRRILQQKKIGHTGTLDPEAEGVLPVCLGAGTKLCDLLTDTGKTYRAVLLLGCTTDTQDTTGTVLSSREVSFSEEEAREAVLSFQGTYDQIPPMYSALKVQGKKLYELARAGVEVERKPRAVTIHEIRIQQIELPRITFTVSCSKGTYIRTLCHDIGEKLGCGGAMEALQRIRVGEFFIEESKTLSEIECLQEMGRLEEYVLPVDAMFPEYTAVKVKTETDRLLKNGNPLKKSDFVESVDPEKDQKLRVYDPSGKFCGIYGWEKEKNIYRPEKMFLDV